VWSTFDDADRPLDTERPAAAAKLLLDQLTWWARALHDARDRVPYTV
jgi:hypothetical protein